MANHQRAHAVPTHMAKLLAGPAHNIPVTTTTTTTTTTTYTATATADASVSPVSEDIGFWTLPGYVPRYIAQVANRVIWTIASKMACLPAIVACLFISTISCYMTLLVAIVAKPQVPGWQRRSRAFPGSMSCLPAGVADTFI